MRAQSALLSQEEDADYSWSFEISGFAAVIGGFAFLIGSLITSTVQFLS